MTEYLVLIYGDEQRWENADEQTRSTVFAVHQEFGRALESRGWKVAATAPLASTTTATTVRGTAETFTANDGPFAETSEQLGGFYLVEADDLTELSRLAAMISFGESVEIRACVSH